MIEHLKMAAITVWVAILIVKLGLMFMDEDGDCRIFKLPMKGYKGFTYSPNDGRLSCRGMSYSVGQRYTDSREPEVCRHGYHFCRKLEDTFSFYNPWCLVAYCEVVADGMIVRNGIKYCTNDLTIVRRLSDREILSILKKERADMDMWRQYFQPEPDFSLRSVSDSMEKSERKRKPRRKSYRRYNKKTLAAMA